MRLLLAVAVLVAGLVGGGGGGGPPPDWGDYLRIHLPRESPRMATARFQFALAFGPTKDSYESLTELTRLKISYFKWKLFLPWIKDPESGHYLKEMIVHALIDTAETSADVVAYYEKAKQSLTVKLFREEEEWKVGLWETFSFSTEDAQAEHEKHQGKPEKEQPEP